MRTSIILLALISASLITRAQDLNLQRSFERSYGLEKEKKYQEAAEILLPLFNQEHYETNLRLGWLYYKAGQLTESLKYYDRCRKLMPMSIEARLGYVLPAAALEHWDQVRDAYLEILRIDPNQTAALYQSGMIAYHRKDYVTADKYFGRLVNLYPFDYHGLLMLGWTRFQQSRLNEAKVLFNKVLLYNPSDASAQEGLSLIK